MMKYQSAQVGKEFEQQIYLAPSMKFIECISTINFDIFMYRVVIIYIHFVRWFHLLDVK